MRNKDTENMFLLKSRVMIDERPSLYQFKSVDFEEQMVLISFFYFFLIIEDFLLPALRLSYVKLIFFMWHLADMLRLSEYFEWWSRIALTADYECLQTNCWELYILKKETLQCNCYPES